MENVIKDYLRDVKLGEGWVTLEKVEDDIFYDKTLKGLTASDIVKVALNNGWKLHNDIEYGWSLKIKSN